MRLGRRTAKGESEKLDGKTGAEEKKNKLIAP